MGIQAVVGTFFYLKKNVSMYRNVNVLSTYHVLGYSIKNFT